MRSTVQLSGPVEIRSKADLTTYMTVVKKAVPAWCRKHQDFESVANEVIAKAQRSHDPARGGFPQHLTIRSRDRVARGLARGAHGVLERSVLVLDLTDASDKDLERSPEVIVDHADSVVSDVTVEAFINTLPEPEGDIVGLLVAGFSQAEIATHLDLHARKVSRIIDGLKPTVAAFFGRMDLLDPVVAA